jgi:biotin-dependent carboxylase-like uncharacterized protein
MTAASGPQAFLRVVRAGLLTTVQDLGRPGRAHLGVPRSGAVDSGAARLANRLVGNAEQAAVLETTLTGCAMAVGRGCWTAVTGAPAVVTVTRGADRRVVGMGESFYAPADSVVDVGSARAGVRSYVAFAGGLATSQVLGSRSFDLLSGLGGEHGLTNGDVLPLGSPEALPPGLGDANVVAVREAEDPAVVRCVPGPRDDWFAADALTRFGAVRWVVGMASNRTALRLEGPSLARSRDGEIASEGLVPGAVQVPPDGRPVVFLADHPVTGGYPVIGCVDPRDLGLLAQARPGTGVRFRMVARS